MTILEADAFPGSFPDADFAFSGTNGKGTEFILDIALADGIIFSVDYYNTSVISGADRDQEILQTDFIFKF